MQQSDERAGTVKDATVKDEPAIKPMFDDAQMRKLRFAVITMGALLLLGFAVVIGRIVFLLNRAPPGDPAAAVPAMSDAALPADVRLALPAGATVRNLSLSGNRLAVHFDAPTGAGIAIVDLATGRAVQRIELAPGR